MQDSNIPAKIATIFAASAPAANVTSPIPTAAQGNGLVSWSTGWQQINFTPLASGGVPPWGKDFNGLFQTLTQIEQWQQAGGPWTYDAAFQSTIGGYPLGTRIQSSIYSGKYWYSTVDNNLSAPDSGGAGWVPWPMVLYGLDTGMTNALAVSLPLPLPAIPVGVIIYVNPLHTNNISNPTLNVNTGGPVVITSPLGGALASGALAQSIPAQIMVAPGPALWLLNPQAGGPVSPTFSAHGAQFFGTPGTTNFTVPATSVNVEVWGGGGGGGGSTGNSGIVQSWQGAPGGGGGYSFGLAQGLTVGSTIAITVGGGGAGGGAGSNDGTIPGGNGGGGNPTTFGGYLEATGGGGGNGAISGGGYAPGAGGSGLFGALNITGARGDSSGDGGAAPRGGAGGTNYFTGQYGPLAPGGGGNGGTDVLPQAGIAGANGGCLVTW